MSTLILPLPGAETLARALAAPAGLPLGTMAFRRFPDGESYYRITCEPKGADVVVVAALRDPDAQALGLWFVADELRRHRIAGAQRFDQRVGGRVAIDREARLALQSTAAAPAHRRRKGELEVGEFKHGRPAGVARP